MTSTHKLVLAVAAILTFVPLSGMARAANGNGPYASEVQSCVAEVGRHANYDEATLVRHTVVVVKETRLRYEFAIDTVVFTDSEESAARSYSAYCVARGDGTPLKFEIENG